MDASVVLPGGKEVPGSSPIVVVGPNGSGKTRQTREMTAEVPIEFINALRNTRVAPELPAVGVETAKANFQSQRNSSKVNHWELSGEFDYMLSQLLAQESTAAIEFVRQYREGLGADAGPEETPLHKVEALWAKVFPGRALQWKDWKPLIRNHSTGADLTYSGNQMSDGEKAALYLAGRVFSAEPGILVVDEPETHLHSLLAARLWNELEVARPDVRFVYVTHDLNFAMSRQAATFVLASPTEGLRVLDLGSGLPEDVTEALLGSASLSFVASRVVFTEGESTSRDLPLYEAWFAGPDTVVRAVGGCQRVMRCVEAVKHSGIAAGLTPVGIVDADYHPEEFRSAFDPSLHMLQVHEVESLLSLPAVVEAICRHVGSGFEEDAYTEALRATVNDDQVRDVTVRRWKRRLEPHLEGLVSAVEHKSGDLDGFGANIPDIFVSANWKFSPEAMFEEERERVAKSFQDGDARSLLRLFPGKQMLAVAARHAGVPIDGYVRMIVGGLEGGLGDRLAASLDSALNPYLPTRYAAVKVASPL